VKHARFVAEARLEFLSEVSYYNRAQEGLGARFAASIEEAAARALVYPLAGTLSVETDTRRVMVKGFPFALHYRPEQEGIVIFAVANHLRQPNYWQNRTKEY
jgi:hypothetical protein